MRAVPCLHLSRAGGDVDLPLYFQTSVIT
ncbi:DUF1472 domain-containing protein [Shigella flexneri]|uniref:DUF1472 domain-containing protein n=2 Tax=Shigella TaxID=620 RepID=A0A3T2V2A2_SHIFL|nr:DUF1472 domain-containing protein [Shigella flexneri]EFX6095361.1 DUF1472 domain-containing protein [Shigella boydii]MKQ12746.1 DUF1472 domain-containing protein [Shigella dysenteriae]EAA1460786.1 DUF1472 domain-containing protein [Shigella flexneri]EAA2185767.1 DUF1472 domain-containing protein [Shigella flexneri]